MAHSDAEIRNALTAVLQDFQAPNNDINSYVDSTIRFELPLPHLSGNTTHLFAGQQRLQVPRNNNTIDMNSIPSDSTMTSLSSDSPADSATSTPAFTSTFTGLPATPKSRKRATGESSTVASSSSNKKSASARKSTKKAPEERLRKVKHDHIANVLVCGYKGTLTESDLTQMPEKPVAKQTELARSLAELNAADRMLWDKKHAGLTYEEIQPEWERLTGTKVAHSTLPNRYARMRARIAHFNEEEDSLLLKCMGDVQRLFEREQWEILAEFMEKQGGVKFNANVLKMRFGELKGERLEGQGGGLSGEGIKVRGGYGGGGDEVEGNGSE